MKSVKLKTEYMDHIWVCETICDILEDHYVTN